LGVYQYVTNYINISLRLIVSMRLRWYRILSPDVEPVQIENVSKYKRDSNELILINGGVHDKSQDTLVLDVQHNFHIRLSPLKPVPTRYYMFQNYHFNLRTH
jgi:hypothetical protein